MELRITAALLFPILFYFIKNVSCLTRNSKGNNVCSTFEDYRFLKTSKNCWYNPDVNAKPQGIAKRHGYKLEDHKLQSSDGYILTIHRVVKINKPPSGTPVYLHHGIACNSAFWLLMGKQSPAFALVDAGFDVWLANARGNEYSMKHANLTIENPKFWDFSYHEMAVIDVPLVINYIRKITGNKQKVNYIGHSMGTTISYIYSSIHREHARNNINIIISIAPIAYLEHIAAWPSVLSPLYELVEKEIKIIGFQGLGQFPQIRKIIQNLCMQSPLISICELVVESIIGSTARQIVPEVLPLFFRRFPGSISMKTLLHYMQNVAGHGKFQWYDYGKDNINRYNSVEPPPYEVEKIEIPVHLIYGDSDLLSTKEDVLKLYNTLTCPKYLELFRGKNSTKFNHNDFLYSRHINDFNNFLISIMKNNMS